MIISIILKEFFIISELFFFEDNEILFFSLLLFIKFLKLFPDFSLNLILSISVLCLFFPFIVLSFAYCLFESISLSFKIYSYLSLYFLGFDILEIINFEFVLPSFSF